MREMAIAQSLTFVWNHPLNAGNRVAALGRVVRWQLASRLFDGPIALPFVEGTALLATKGATGVTGNWYCGLHEVHEMGFVLHVLRPDDLFLDIGANAGSYTILAAGADRARVISVEPVPSTFAKLQRNIAFNGLADRAVAIQCGVSEHAGSLRFTNQFDTMNRVAGNDDGRHSVEAAVRTIDDLAGAAGPTVIKIDVEGHEAAVLRGARRTLADHRLLALIVEINGLETAAHSSDDVVAALRSEGFTARSYDPFTRTLVTLPNAVGNVIFVRDVQAVEARVRSAPRYKLVNGEI